MKMFHKVAESSSENAKVLIRMNVLSEIKALRRFSRVLFTHSGAAMGSSEKSF